ncbi:uncharacterized protein NMK_2252 [Novimethylophilus kurashikiensis]|uniref:Uncharacterized protein n=1 Tax=Novimethylophilus kurashikiensis TaxID=1825523 RepID=A0A2R5FCJ7_9PROT|nr:hypothetical protein [Novimethylophilus kurashikiensis]GBG14653.1 uncharacterized protein NMK_2252 [Novimethylophilus kurashikiensis]
MKNMKPTLTMMLLAAAAQIALMNPVHAAGADADIQTDVKSGVQTDTDKGQASERMSNEATINANSPAVGQEKGQDRATERKAIDHSNQGKHKGKSSDRH